jgi:hypothetical protein
LLRHPKKVSFKTTVTETLTTVRGTKITPLLRYPHHYNVALTVTACLCMTAAHYRESTNFSNCPRIYKPYEDNTTIKQNENKSSSSSSSSSSFKYRPAAYSGSEV